MRRKSPVRWRISLSRSGDAVRTLRGGALAAARPPTPCRRPLGMAGAPAMPAVAMISLMRRHAVVRLPVPIRSFATPKSRRVAELELTIKLIEHRRQRHLPDDLTLAERTRKSFVIFVLKSDG